MSLFKKFLIALLLGLFLLNLSAVYAGEGGEGGGGEGGGKNASNDMLIPVEAITVNLIGPTQQYLQVEMTLKLSTPEVSEKVKTFMPVVRHTMIMLLSSKDANQLTPLQGKQKLVQESKEAINNALNLTEKSGVMDVLFSSFIIQ